MESVPVRLDGQHETDTLTRTKKERRVGTPGGPTKAGTVPKTYLYISSGGRVQAGVPGPFPMEVK
jgi:hypothetical protein